jgi:hypothetical protein
MGKLLISNQLVLSSFLLAQAGGEADQLQEVQRCVRIDISRIFDSLSWPYLFETLCQLGFWEMAKYGCCPAQYGQH